MAFSTVPVKSTSSRVYLRNAPCSTCSVSAALVSPPRVSAALSSRACSVPPRRAFSSPGTTWSSSPCRTSAHFSNSSASRPRSFFPTGKSSLPSRNEAVTSWPRSSQTSTVPRSKSRFTV